MTKLLTAVAALALLAGPAAACDMGKSAETKDQAGLQAPAPEAKSKAKVRLAKSKAKAKAETAAAAAPASKL